MISAFGTLNGSMMTGPRIFFAMADDGLFFKKIASVHPRFKTPYVAISLAAALAVVFVMVRTFEQLTDAFVLAIWPFYAGGAAAVYALRRKRPDLPRAYRTWGYPVTPILFILAVILLIGNAMVEDLAHGLRDNFGYYRALFTGSALPYESSGALLVFAIVLALMRIARAAVAPNRSIRGLGDRGYWRSRWQPFLQSRAGITGNLMCYKVICTTRP
jgi:amino acid transporter